MFKSFELSALPLRLREKIYVEPNTGCWLWLGYLNSDGYARSSGQWQYVHRRIYEFFSGPIPEALELDHLCRTRCCVNPAHLQPVPHIENIKRGNSHQTQFKAQTHCKRGHVLDEANSHWDQRGRRSCRKCKSWRSAEAWRKAHPGSRRYKPRK
jgi:HNH endonuclease